MEKQEFMIHVSDSLGKVSATTLVPPSMKGMFVFAHGAGAGKDHRFMLDLSTKLGEAGLGTLRFNFPYMENGGKRPDPPAIACKTIVRALEEAKQVFPNVPLFAGGKSFGGRMSSHVIHQGAGPGVKGLIFVGFPLHAPGKAGTERAVHLKSIRVPMLFLQGTKDTLARIDLVEEVVSGLTAADLITLEGADHSFKAGKRDTLSELVSPIIEWVDRHL